MWGSTDEYMPKERGNNGRFTSSVSDEDILFFFETGERPFYGTGEVAEEFDLSNTQAGRRLSDLCETGELKRVTLDERRTLWWRQRDVITIRPESEGYSAHDTASGIASGGESRPEALRNLAEAIEARRAASEEIDPELSEEFEVDSGNRNSHPPF
jgi:predicted RNase H-like HicB family nuclease